MTTTTTAPALHFSYPHMPRDRTGPLGGSAASLLKSARADQAFWPTHVFLELFQARTHDRFWRQLEPHGPWSLRPELLREYGALVDAMATACLDQVEEQLGGWTPPPTVRIFPDFEYANLRRHPYIEPEAGGYGSRDIASMTYLCNRIEFLGGRRWGNTVLAGPYHAARTFGHWAGISDPAPSFVTKWHSPVAALLDRSVAWIHCYMPDQEENFNRRGQTWRQFARGTIRGQLDAILASGGQPEEVFIWGWTYTEIRGDKAEALFLAVQDVLAERDWPFAFHIGIAGGWNVLHSLVDAPVEQVQRSPLELSIGADLAGNALVAAWNREVEAAYARVFQAAGLSL